MIAFQLSKEQVTKLHNAQCYLGNVIERLRGVVHPDRVAELEKEHKAIREVMQPIWEEEDRLTNIGSKAAAEAADTHQLKYSVWAYDPYMTDFYDRHAWQGAGWLADGYRKVPIRGNTWVDLWVAADQLIKMAGNNNHIFIEDFSVVGGDPETNTLTLQLHTGS
jgi:hypothetical protein